MKRERTTRWTVDWGAAGEPRIDDIVHRFTPTMQDAGYYRVTSVRLVNNRKPLPKPYVARYRCTVVFIGDEWKGEVDWPLHAYPPRPKLHDRFSPLL